MGESERIELSLPGWQRAAYVVAGITLLLGAYVAAVRLAAEKEPTAWQWSATLAGFAAAYLMWRSAMGRALGRIEIDASGVLLDTHAIAGRIAWENFEKAGAVRSGSGKLQHFLARIGLGHLAKPSRLGIALLDPQPFVAGRPAATGRRATTGRRKPVAASGPFRPWLAKARSGRQASPEPARLARNRGKFGYDVIIDVTGIADAAEIAARIEAHRPVPGLAAAAASLEAANAAVPPAEAGAKICPMCAEPVRAAARICRFCRHVFEPLPAPSDGG